MVYSGTIAYLSKQGTCSAAALAPSPAVVVLLFTAATTCHKPTFAFMEAAQLQILYDFL